MIWIAVTAVVGALTLLSRQLYKEKKLVETQLETSRRRYADRLVAHSADAVRFEKVIRSQKQRIKQLQGVVSDAFKKCTCGGLDRDGAILDDLFRYTEESLNPQSELGLRGLTPSPSAATSRLLRGKR